jgi:hypothetical protein
MCAKVHENHGTSKREQEKSRPTHENLSTLSNTAEEVTGNSVKKTGIIFTPGKRLQEMLKTAKFTKA